MHPAVIHGVRVLSRPFRGTVVLRRIAFRVGDAALTRGVGWRGTDASPESAAIVSGHGVLFQLPSIIGRCA